MNERADAMHAGGQGHAPGETWVWWMHEETAWCPFCSQGYAWELHVACVGCDRPTCPLCVDHEHADGPHCPECVAEAQPREQEQEASA
jgi:hypothetical protein